MVHAPFWRMSAVWEGPACYGMKLWDHVLWLCHLEDTAGRSALNALHLSCRSVSWFFHQRHTDTHTHPVPRAASVVEADDRSPGNLLGPPISTFLEELTEPNGASPLRGYKLDMAVPFRQSSSRDTSSPAHFRIGCNSIGIGRGKKNLTQVVLDLTINHWAQSFCC